MNAGTISYPVRSLRFAGLSPHHVAPAVRHLARPEEVESVRFLFVERETAGDRGLVGARVLARANPRRAFPLPHLRAYRSPHSLLSHEAHETFFRAKMRSFGRDGGLTKGNLSSHLAKLEEAGCVVVTKGYQGKVPHTDYRLTDDGRTAFRAYRGQMRRALKKLSR